jgi:hypothetical protein
MADGVAAPGASVAPTGCTRGGPGNLFALRNLVIDLATDQLDRDRASPEPVPTNAEALDAYSTVVTSVAERLLPSVVQLRVMGRGGRNGRDRGGAGSGVVITPDGFVLTSAHVLGKAKSGIATLSDGRELPFDVTGTDGLSDLGLVRVRGDGLTAAELDAAARLQAGEPFKKQAAIAKLHSSEAAMDAAREACQVFGGYGFTTEYAVGRFYHDAKILEIGEGTSEVQRLLIARARGLPQ